ncbi:MAG TPA: AzlC family ABC transporter permease [Thermoleophilaceae bacterium]|nr:AzlC family ABC transporter permease [Thermoleophilaceae bacterium]
MRFVTQYRSGIRLALPLAVAVLAFGISFGVLARDAGMGSLAPFVMSTTTFAGSAQFAVASVLSTGGGLAAACVAAILLNARYAPIGMSVADALSPGRVRRLLEAQLVVDESWALSNRGGGRFDRRILIGAGAVLYVAWVGGTALGIVGGKLIGDPNDLGLDAAFPALFLALLVGQIRSRQAALAAVVGATIALATIPFTKPGIPLIAACVACLVGWRRR